MRGLNTSRAGPSALRVTSALDFPQPLYRQQFDAWNRYAAPQTEQVDDRTWAIAMPIDAAGRSFVYLYVLETGDGLALIDTGYDTSGAVAYIAAELQRIGRSLADLRHILCTHYHRDHYGNVRELKRLTGATVYLHPIDQMVLHTLRNATEHREAQVRLWQLMGWTVPLQPDELERAGNPFADVVPSEPDLPLHDGDIIVLGDRRLQAIWTPGHSPGLVCFFETSRAVLFASDQLLPRLTPGVSIQPFQRPNPLADFCSSLRKLQALEATAVYPGHEYSFGDPGSRIATILKHHEDRLAEIFDVVRTQPGLSCAEIAAQVRWSRPWASMTGRYGRMAAGETMAHLTFLEGQGAISHSGYAPRRWWNTGELVERQA